MRRALVFLAFGALVAGSFAAAYRLSSGSRAAEPVATPTVVDEVRAALSSRYYRQVPARVLDLRSVDAMIAALGDPYTAYLGPEEYRLLRQQTASRYSGIGVSVLAVPHGLAVVSLRPGPAQRAGVRAGDTIVRIGGVPVDALDTTHALARILGARGSVLRLGLVRDGHRVDLKIRRAVISAPVVHAGLLSYAGRRWGQLRLSMFRAGAVVVLARELRVLEREGAKGIVLDLRGNPGGLLDQAVAVASLFLDHGPVVKLVGRHRYESYSARGGPVTRLPLVVLVDRDTASSAEIVAAALHDNGRAFVVGQRTYGKALVQSLDPLDDGGALELTVARYKTPLGRDISSVGVQPQLRAVDDRRTRADEALLAALGVLARPAS